MMNETTQEFVSGVTEILSPGATDYTQFCENNISLLIFIIIFIGVLCGIILGFFLFRFFGK